MMTDEEIKDKLRKMLFLTQRANECGLSNNDFKEDIDTLSGALGLLDKKDKVIDLMAEMYIKLARELSIYKEVTDINGICFGCKYEDEECNGNDCIERFKIYISKKVEEE